MHVACRARGAWSVAIIFPSEQERLSEDWEHIGTLAERLLWP